MDDTANDFAGTNHGSIQGNTAVNQTGKINGAFAFDGYEDRVIVTPITLNGDWSIAYWYYQNAADKIIMGQNGTDQNRLYHYTTTLYHIKFNDGSHDFFAFTQSLNSWHHVVVTRQGSTVTVYKDGAYSDSKTISNANFIFDSIGDGYGGGGYDWNGMIDDVRIYDGALPASQVNGLFNEASNPTPTHTFTPTNTPTSPPPPTPTLTSNILTKANFPDDNFREAIADIVGESITQADAANETGYWDFSYKLIGDLTGLEHFTGLTGLDVSHNNIQTLDLHFNTQLTEVIANNNLLTAINAENNSVLNYLDIRYNRLTDLASLLANNGMDLGDTVNASYNFLDLNTTQSSDLMAKFGAGFQACPQYDDSVGIWTYDCAHSIQPQGIYEANNPIPDHEVAGSYLYHVIPFENVTRRGKIKLKVEYDSMFDGGAEYLTNSLNVSTVWEDIFVSSNGQPLAMGTGTLQAGGGLVVMQDVYDPDHLGISGGSSEAALNAVFKGTPGDTELLTYHLGILYEDADFYFSNTNQSSNANWLLATTDGTLTSPISGHTIEYGIQSGYIKQYSVLFDVNEASVNVWGFGDYLGFSELEVFFYRPMTNLPCAPGIAYLPPQLPVPTPITPFPTSLTPSPTGTPVPPTATPKPESTCLPTPTPICTPSGDPLCCCKKAEEKFNWDMDGLNTYYYCAVPIPYRQENCAKAAAIYVELSLIFDAWFPEGEPPVGGPNGLGLDWSGNERDALFHLWVMCLVTSCTSKSFGKGIGDAHERDYPYDQDTCGSLYQDLDNNELAREKLADINATNWCPLPFVVEALIEGSACFDVAKSEVEFAHVTYPNLGIGSGGNNANTNGSGLTCGQ